MAGPSNDNAGLGLVVVKGKMGAGKTMFAVRYILQDLAKGRVVYSNIELNWEACVRYHKKRGIEVPRENYRHLTVEHNWHEQLAEGSLVVLDEAQLTYNARDFGKTDKEERDLLTFIPQARKWGCQVWIVTQHEGNVDTQFLRQAAYYYRAYDLWHNPLIKMLLPWPFSIISKLDSDGKTRLESFWMHRGKELYQCYDTRQKYKVFNLGGAPGAPVQGKYNPPNKGRALVILGAVLALLGMGIRRMGAPRPTVPVVTESPRPVPPVRVVTGDPSPPLVSGPGLVSTPVKAPPAPDSEETRTAVEQDLPGFVRVFGGTSSTGRPGGNTPVIAMADGTRVRVGSWLCGRVLSWVMLSPECILLSIDHPLKTIKIYDYRLDSRRCNAIWNTDSRRVFPSGHDVPLRVENLHGSPQGGVTSPGPDSREALRTVGGVSFRPGQQ